LTLPHEAGQYSKHVLGIGCGTAARPATAPAGRSAQHQGASAPASPGAAVDSRPAARELGISHGLASHHLHQLAKYGFVEQVGGADNRERPWQLVATSHSHEGIEGKPGGAAAVAVLEQVVAERTLAALQDWQERRAGWSAGWREHAGVGRSMIYLTEQELAGLVGAIESLIVDYVEKRPLDDLSSRPPGSVPVEFTMFVVPAEPTSGGN
jgi:hypothetical protein